MEVKIGVQHSPRELIVETDASAEDVETQLSAAITEGGVLSITDSKGRRVVIPADKISYVELGGGVSGTVGFR